MTSRERMMRALHREKPDRLPVTVHQWQGYHLQHHMGGNIADPAQVRRAFTGRLAMIGGMDQFNILTDGTHDRIRVEVRRPFEGFGRDGDYILSTSDHFFETPRANLEVYAAAARECTH